MNEDKPRVSFYKLWKYVRQGLKISNWSGAMEYNKIFQDIKRETLKTSIFFGQEQYLCEELIRTLKNVLINPILKI